MIESLRLFVRIVEKGGLASAGRDFGLSPASVSERLAALEREYGCTLIKRTTRSISLTEEGRLLFEGARGLVAEADDLAGRIRNGIQTVSGPIRISAPVDLGRTRLVPLLDRFMDEHSGVSIDLELTDGYADLVGKGFDLAIRHGLLEDSTMRIRTLGSNRRTVCASPDYLRRHGTPLHPDELGGHECLAMRFGQNLECEWPFMIDGKLRRIRVQARRVANDGALVREWCKQGHGLALKSIWDVGKDLVEGSLVEVLRDYGSGETSLQIIFPPAGTMPRRIELLVRTIVDHFRGDPLGNAPEPRRGRTREPSTPP